MLDESTVVTESVKELVERTLAEKDYAVHPAVEELALPYPSTSEFDALCRDIKANGPRVKIHRSADGKIVDGRLRLAAMLRAGITPQDKHFITFGEKTDAFVKLLVAQLNVNRRHLASSQLAMMVVRMKAKGVPIYNDDYKTMGTSGEAVARAARVLKSGKKAVIEAVEKGEMAVSHADKVISGRDPIKPGGARAMASATPADEAVHAVAEPKSRGRQPGNIKVNAVKRGIAELVKASDHADEVKTYWRPDADEVAEIKSCRKLLSDLLQKGPA